MSCTALESDVLSVTDRNTHLSSSQLAAILRWICKCSFLPPRLRYNATVLTPITIEDFFETVHTGISAVLRCKSNTLQIIPLLTRPKHWCLLAIDSLTHSNQMVIIYSDPDGAPMEIKLEQELRGIFPTAPFNDLRQSLLPNKSELYDSGICVSEVVRRLLHYISIQLNGFNLSNSWTFDDSLHVMAEDLTHQERQRYSEINVSLLAKRREVYRLALKSSCWRSNAERIVKFKKLEIEKPIVMAPVQETDGAAPITQVLSESQACATQSVLDIEQSQLLDESDDAPIFIPPQPPKKRARTADAPRQLSLSFLTRS